MDLLELTESELLWVIVRYDAARDISFVRGFRGNLCVSSWYEDGYASGTHQIGSISFNGVKHEPAPGEKIFCSRAMYERLVGNVDN